MKNIFTNPELVKVGQKCKVLSNTHWWKIYGYTTNEHNVYLPAVIKEISYKANKEIPALILKVRYSPKYNNWPLDSLMVLSCDIAENNDIVIFE